MLPLLVLRHRRERNACRSSKRLLRQSGRLASEFDPRAYVTHEGDASKALLPMQPGTVLLVDLCSGPGILKR